MTAETNKERLERIKEHWDSDIQEEWDCVEEDSISWLIQQAEKLQTLEESLEEELGGR